MVDVTETKKRKTQKRVPTKIKLPPLQTVFDIPSSPLPIPPAIDGTIEGEGEGTIEGMESLDKTKEAFYKGVDVIKMVKAKIIDIFDYTNYSVYQYIYWVIKKYASETEKDEEIANDASIVYTCLIFLLIIPIIIYFTYNWYYLLFYTEKTNDVMSTITFDFMKNPKRFPGFLTEFIWKPTELLHTFLFFILPNFIDPQKNVSPLQTLNIYFILIVLILGGLFVLLPDQVPISWVFSSIGFFLLIAYLLIRGNYGWVFCFMIFFTLFMYIVNFVSGIAVDFFKLLSDDIFFYIIVWGYFAFWCAQNLQSYQSGQSQSIIVLIGYLIYFYFRGFITYFFLDYTIFFFKLYLFAMSMFGFALNEGNMMAWKDILHMDAFMKTKEEAFMQDFTKSNFIHSLYNLASVLFHGFFKILFMAYILFVGFYFLFGILRIHSLRVFQIMIIVSLILLLVFTTYLMKDAVAEWAKSDNKPVVVQGVVVSEPGDSKKADSNVNYITDDDADADADSNTYENRVASYHDLVKAIQVLFQIYDVNKEQTIEDDVPDEFYNNKKEEEDDNFDLLNGDNEEVKSFILVEPTDLTNVSPQEWLYFITPNDTIYIGQITNTNTNKLHIHGFVAFEKQPNNTFLYKGAPTMMDFELEMVNTIIYKLHPELMFNEQLAPEQASEPASEQASEPASEPASEQAPEQASEQASEPASEQASEPAPEQDGSRSTGFGAPREKTDHLPGNEGKSDAEMMNFVSGTNNFKTNEDGTINASAWDDKIKSADECEQNPLKCLTEKFNEGMKDSQIQEELKNSTAEASNVAKQATNTLKSLNSANATTEATKALKSLNSANATTEALKSFNPTSFFK